MSSARKLKAASGTLTFLFTRRSKSTCVCGSGHTAIVSNHFLTSCLLFLLGEACVLIVVAAAESTCARVLWWSILEAVVLVVISAWQIYHLRSFLVRAGLDE